MVARDDGVAEGLLEMLTVAVVVTIGEHYQPRLPSRKRPQPLAGYFRVDQGAGGLLLLGAHLPYRPPRWSFSGHSSVICSEALLVSLPLPTITCCASYSS